MTPPPSCLSIISPTHPDEDFIPALLSPNLQPLLPSRPLSNLASDFTKKIEAFRKEPPHTPTTISTRPCTRVCVHDLLPVTVVSCPALPCPGRAYWSGWGSTLSPSQGWDSRGAVLPLLTYPNSIETPSLSPVLKRKHRSLPLSPLQLSPSFSFCLYNKTPERIAQTTLLPPQFLSSFLS